MLESNVLSLEVVSTVTKTRVGMLTPMLKAAFKATDVTLITRGEGDVKAVMVFLPADVTDADNAHQLICELADFFKGETTGRCMVMSEENASMYVTLFGQK